MNLYERGYLAQVKEKMDLKNLQAAYAKIWIQKDPDAIKIAAEYSKNIKEQLLSAYTAVQNLKELDKQINEMINQ
jgi:hypothetical protein